MHLLLKMQAPFHPLVVPTTGLLHVWQGGNSVTGTIMSGMLVVCVRDTVLWRPQQAELFLAALKLLLLPNQQQGYVTVTAAVCATNHLN